MWDGNPYSPITFNRWTYAKDNAINLTDPSGWLTPDEEIKANQIIEPLLHKYNVLIPKEWGWGWYQKFDLIPCNGIPFATKLIGWTAGDWRNLHELELTRDAIETMARRLGGQARFRSAMIYPVTIRRLSQELIWRYGALSLNNVILPNNVFSSTDLFAKGQITHELAHVWDTRHGLQLSQGMKYATGSYKQVCNSSDGVCVDFYDSNFAIEEAPTNYAKDNAREDWADSFAVFIYSTFREARPLGPIRRHYIAQAIKDIPKLP